MAGALDDPKRALLAAERAIIGAVGMYRASSHRIIVTDGDNPTLLAQRDLFSNQFDQVWIEPRGIVKGGVGLANNLTVIAVELFLVHAAGTLGFGRCESEGAVAAYSWQSGAATCQAQRHTWQKPQPPLLRSGAVRDPEQSVHAQCPARI